MSVRVPEDQRKYIARLFVEGVSRKEICRRTGRSKSAVTRVVKAFRSEGRIADAPCSGRPRVTEAVEDEQIIAAAVVNPFINAREMKEELALDASCDTIHRRLKEAGLQNRVAARKPCLTDQQRRQRLEFAQAHEHWTTEDWAQVIFTDESTFTTRHDQQLHVWRPLNTRYGCNWHIQQEVMFFF